MSDHDTHDYEHVWPPYGVQLAQPEVRTFPDRMLVWCSRLEQRIEALEATVTALQTELAGTRQALGKTEYVLFQIAHGRRP